MTRSERGGRARALPLPFLALAAAALVLMEAADDSSPMTTEPAPAPDSLVLRLQLPHDSPPDGPIEFTLVVENPTGRPVTLYLLGREPTMDVTVERLDGVVVWRRLEDEVVPSILRVETLPPDSSLTVRAAWDRRTKEGAAVPAGSYRVRAELLTEDASLAAPMETLRLPD